MNMEKKYYFGYNYLQLYEKFSELEVYKKYIENILIFILDFLWLISNILSIILIYFTLAFHLFSWLLINKIITWEWIK